MRREPKAHELTKEGFEAFLRKVSRKIDQPHEEPDQEPIQTSARQNGAGYNGTHTRSGKTEGTETPPRGKRHESRS